MDFFDLFVRTTEYTIKQVALFHKRPDFSMIKTEMGMRELPIVIVKNDIYDEKEGRQTRAYRTR